MIVEAKNAIQESSQDIPLTNFITKIEHPNYINWIWSIAKIGIAYIPITCNRRH